MSVPVLRKFLRSLSDEEWQQVLKTCPALLDAPGLASKRALHTVDAIKRWVAVPGKSDPYLEQAIRLAAASTLVDDDAGHDAVTALPADEESLRGWLSEVAARLGTGPAKLCLLAAREDSRGGLAADGFQELLTMIQSTPFAGLRGPDTGKPGFVDPTDPSHSGTAPAEPAEDVAKDSPGEWWSDHGALSAALEDEDLVALGEALAGVRQTADTVTSALSRAIGQITRGEFVADDVAADVADYANARERLVADFRAITADADSADFDRLAQALVDMAAQRRTARRRQHDDEARALAEKATGLRTQIAAIEGLLANPDNPARPQLEEALATSRARLAQIEGVASAEAQHLDRNDVNDGSSTEVGLETRVEPESLNESGDLGRDSQPGVSPTPSSSDQPSATERQADLAGVAHPTARADVLAEPGPSAEPGERISAPALPPTPTDAEQQDLERAPESSCDESGGIVPNGVVALVSQHRPLAASLVAQAADPDGILAQALQFNGAAYACGAGSITPTDAILLGTHLPLDTLEANRSAAVAAVAGAARAGLSAGWTHRPLLEGLPSVLPLDASWQALLDAIVDATYHGYVHAATIGDASPVSREELGQRAGAVRSELQSSRTKYVRATRVLQRLLRDDGPLGEGLAAVVRWGEGSDEALGDIRRVAAGLATPRARERLIEDADALVSTSQQRRSPIIAGARHQLETRIDQVADLLSACSSAVGPFPHAVTDDAFSSRLVSAAEDAADRATSDPFEAAVLDELRSWILDPNTPHPERGRTVAELALRASLPLWDVSRGEDGMPSLVDAEPDGLARRLLNPPGTDDLVESYIRVGNLAAARMAADGNGALVSRVDAAARGWEEKLDGRVRYVETELARARAEHKMDVAAVSSAEGALRSAIGYQGDRYDLQMSILDRIADELRRSLESETARLRTELDNLKLPDGDVRCARVLTLIEAGDLMTVREYLYRLGRDEELPAERLDDPSMLEDFLRSAESVDTRAVTATDVYDRVGDGTAPTGTAQAGLSGWKQLVANPQRQSRDNLSRVLRLLGLDADRMPHDITERGSGASKSFAVRADPLDGSIVPGLGSRAGRQYYVTVLDKDRTDPQQALALIPSSRSGLANLVLVPWSLTVQQRRQFLRAGRESRTRALVVDAACVGYLAARAPGSFRALQEITLPFAVFPHYTPSVAGDVPEEVFVGRVEEAEQIVSPTGSLFVYGGRQLGKSALLRHIATTQTDGHGRHAIYVDLKAKMIGEAQDPAHLWVVLLEEFQRAGIIGPRVTTGTAKAVIEHTQHWLLEDETRRLLLLLDEADLFLESEARQRREGNRVVRFANISPLKDLMESTNRRFKPVFAGLHQVQRFHEISNTPLAHGGTDILVGPLDPRSALDLVERPMAALGYRFTNRDLISRLLAFANYQASLIQIVCDALVTQMSKKAPAAGQPPVRITDADIDRVTQDTKVRRHLAERLRLTIALEDRYLVIALVVAVLSLEDNFTQGYESSEILSWCRDYWPGGFGDMTAKDFALYLEEMEGLGVLVRRPDGLVSVRSPNVVAMLGTKSELEQQLAEGAYRFELPHDYNPRVSRRTLRRGADDVRSPLTEQDLQVLLPKSKATTGVNLIVGSPALGVNDVSWVLEEVARERDKQITHVRARGFADWVTASGNPTQRSRSELPIVDATDLPTEDVGELLELVKRTTDRRKDQAVIVVAGPTATPLVRIWAPRVSSLITLERWSDEGLRSWSDGPFGPAEHRVRTLAATSGWPRLVREVARRSMDGEPLHVVVESTAQYPDTELSAREFLQAVGASDDLDLLAHWADIAKPGETVDPHVLDAILADEVHAQPGAFVECADRMQLLGIVTGDPGTMTLDPVVHRALALVGGPSGPRLDA